MFVELQSSQDPLWFPSQLCQKDTCGTGCLVSGNLNTAQASLHLHLKTSQLMIKWSGFFPNYKALPPCVFDCKTKLGPLS
jgi:hypothetical protein